MRKQEAATMMQTLPHKRMPRFVSCVLAAAAAAAILLCPSGPVLAQTGGCNLLPDDREPSVRILRCGEDLTMRIAANTDYQLTQSQGQALPSGAQLKAGALMVDFKPGP